jgi:copper chaperone NosL
VIPGAIKVISLVCVAALTGACRQGVPQPVDIVLDEDSCAVCRMAVSQQRFAAEVAKPDGTALYFDDIGCLVEFAREPGVPSGAAAYVVDFDSQDWLAAGSASYLFAKSLPTPMSYGLGAFSTAAQAQAAAKEWPGKVLTWDQVVEEWQP